MKETFFLVEVKFSKTETLNKWLNKLWNSSLQDLQTTSLAIIDEVDQKQLR